MENFSNLIRLRPAHSKQLSSADEARAEGRAGSPHKASAALHATFVSPGVWLATTAVRAKDARAGLFLDRDGVIVHDPGYLSDPGQVRLMDGAADLIAAANARDIPVAVVTNQSGIARGYFDWQAFEAVQAEIARQLGTARLNAVVACPFHPDLTQDPDNAWEGWRKPGPKMIALVADRLNVDIARSAMVGDHISDLLAAHAAGLAGAVLVRTGLGEECLAEAEKLATQDFAVALADGAGDAVSKLRTIGLPI